MTADFWVNISKKANTIPESLCLRHRRRNPLAQINWIAYSPPVGAPFTFFAETEATVMLLQCELYAQQWQPNCLHMNCSHIDELIHAHECQVHRSHGH